MSTRLDGAAPAPRATADDRAWKTVVGIQGGYTRVHAVNGAGDLSALSLPGIGGNLSGTGSLTMNPPTMFVIFPVGRKLAIEPGLDIHRTQGNGQTISSINLSTRANYAVTGGWYAAAGGNLVLLHATGVGGGNVAGANLAWGYRFPVKGSLGGRAEINYTMMADNSTFGVPPMNTLGVMLGLTMAMK